MPSLVTEIDEFTGPLTMPDGDDDMSDAADVVQAFVQGLANRSFYLLTRQVRNDGDSTIANGKLVINTSSPDIPALELFHSPGEDPDSSNPWREWTKAKLDASGARFAKLYYGNADTGVFGVVINATWDIDDQLWRQDNSAKKSLAAFISPTNGLEYTEQAAGVASWSSWPTNAGNMLARGNLTARAIGAVLDAAVGGEYKYSGFGYKLRTSIVPIGSACGSYVRTTSGSIKQGNGTAVAWPVRLPRDAQYTVVQVKHRQASGTRQHFQIQPRSGGAWSGGPVAPTTNTLVDVLSDAGTDAGVNCRVTELTINASFDNADDELELVWLPPIGGTNDEVLQIRIVDWKDRGPHGDVL